MSQFSHQQQNNNSKYGGIGYSLHDQGGGGGGGGIPASPPTSSRFTTFPQQHQKDNKYNINNTHFGSSSHRNRGPILIAGLVCLIVLVVIVVSGNSADPNRDSPTSVRRSLHEKQTLEEVSEEKEREAYFVNTKCKNAHITYTREEARVASQDGIIPFKKWSAMNPITNTVGTLSTTQKQQTRAEAEADHHDHHTTQRIIIVVHTWVLDVTAFLPHHPGGKMLLEGVGMADSGHIFMQHHSPSTTSLLSDFCVGFVHQ